MDRLTFIFNSKDDLDKFIAWWLDGGGDQSGPFSTQVWNLKTKEFILEEYKNEEDE